MRSREQGWLRWLDPLCVQWKFLGHQLLLFRLAGSQADHAKCAHQSPGALEELPSPATTDVLPQSAPACLVQVGWSPCPALGVLLEASLGLVTEAASPWTG